MFEVELNDEGKMFVGALGFLPWPVDTHDDGWNRGQLCSDTTTTAEAPTKVTPKEVIFFFSQRQ